jgi:uncharacterized protein (DUF2147 family)
MSAGKIFMGGAIVLAALSGLSGTAAAQDATGVWRRPSTGTEVQFYDCSGKLCARIVAVKDDTKKSTVGTVIMKGASKTGAGEWKGDLLNTDNNQIYSGVVKLEGPRALSLKGCVAGGLICSGETWTKVR